ncbi:dipeptidyl aminopeptidase [Mycena floridula]|nr:dipeptidyl aminopeptidase [Mycena floridula]
MVADYERLSQDEDSLLRKPEFSITRPPTYYEDGPFDAPSSDSEDGTLLDKSPPSPGIAERGDLIHGLSIGNSFARKRGQSSLRFLVLTLAGLLTLSALIGIIAAHTYAGVTYRAPGSLRITMDHIFNGTFAVQRRSLEWVPEAGDGVFSISEQGYIKLVDLKTNKTSNMLAVRDVKDELGRPLKISKWKLSPDMKYVLVKTDYKKQWRHSAFGNYYIHNIKDKTTHPMIPPTSPPKTVYATWSPTGQSIAYVTSNDLYILTSPLPNAKPVQLTNSNSSTIFNGVPSWVYEEEIFSADSSLWWSPDSSKLAFLSFDETLVDEFSFPIYNPTEDSNTVVPYTSTVKMRYPKPGYQNPLVKAFIFDVAGYRPKAGIANAVQEELFELDWEGRHPVENSVIMEVAWVADQTLLIKEVNRNADNGSVVFFDLAAPGVNAATRSRGQVVRTLGKHGEEGDDGWIDNSQSVFRLPSSLLKTFGTSATITAYLDIVPTPEGYNHIALFMPADSSTPRFLTNGNWEVSGSIKGVDAKGLVYFEAANPSTARHLYSVSLPPLGSSPSKIQEPTILSDMSEPVSYHRAEFSPAAGFYLLSYEGPNVPWQRVVAAHDPTFDYVLTTNDALSNTTLLYETPTVIYSTIEIDGYELNVKEMRPPRMDDSGRTKYAVLFRVYGGPFSQLVDVKYVRDWHDYLVCGMQYIVVTVDGRGTGFKGRKLRNPVKGNLGYWETVDQVNAARIWASKNYVDPKRIGIWGWSYGGFMSGKVVEADAGIHSLAMSVAPVTSWRLYDSIYTERYLNLPDVNPGGYINASISNVTAFSKVDYLLAHGSADDNVHFANSAHLLDMFTKAHYRNFRFRMFTDSDHNIMRRAAIRELYEFMTAFLLEKWGKGGRRRGW